MRFGRTPTRLDRAPAPGNHSINKQHDNGANNGTDQPGTFPRPIPTQRLSEECRNERTYDSENCRKNESGWLIVSRHDEFGNHTRYKSD